MFVNCMLRRSGYRFILSPFQRIKVLPSTINPRNFLHTGSPLPVLNAYDDWGLAHGKQNNDSTPGLSLVYRALEKNDFCHLFFLLEKQEALARPENEAEVKLLKKIANDPKFSQCRLILRRFSIEATEILETGKE